jgi:iron complex transport system substrate-binding protein
VPAFRFALPLTRPLTTALAAVALVLSACGGSAASNAPTIPPDATGSLLPAETATPPASAPASASVAPAFPVTLTDDEGTKVELKSEPKKIVSLTPAETEVLFALGVGDRVVGKVEDSTPYPPEITAIPDVAKFGVVDVEKIVGLGVDLVIAGGNSFNPPDKIAQLRRLGIPVLVVYAPDLDTVFADIELTGTAVGKAAEAKDLTASMKAGFDQVAAATASLTKPRVYYELDATNGFFGPAPDYFGTAMIELAGGQPLTSGTAGVFKIPAETIISFDPQIILLGDASYGVTVDAVEARPGWNVISAVKTGDIRPIDDVIVTRAGPRLLDGLRALALAIHPDAAIPSPQPPASAPAASASTAP